MNANNILPGEEYAWDRYPRRSPGTFYPQARKVKVIRTLSVNVGAGKRRTMVEVFFTNSRGELIERTVRARQIVYRWSEHEEMLAAFEAKEALRRIEIDERNARYAREDAERREKYEREQAEMKARIAREREPVYRLFERVGIPRESIRYGFDYITINKAELERIANEQSLVQ